MNCIDIQIFADAYKTGIIGNQEIKKVTVKVTVFFKYFILYQFSSFWLHLQVKKHDLLKENWVLKI